MIADDRPRRSGPLLVAIGAALFAGVNAAATALYRRNGCSVVVLYIIRSAVLYVVNGLLVAVRDGSTAARRVLLLQTGNGDSARLTLLRSILQSTMALGLSVAFVFLTFADAFTVFKGVAVFSTLALSRTVLGKAERLSTRELTCGALTLVGITLVAQPPLLFGDRADDSLPSASVGQSQWTPRFGAGIPVAVVSGVISAACGILLRVLSQSG